MLRLVIAISLAFVPVVLGADAAALERAAALARQGKHDEAIRLVTAELAAHPNDADAREVRAGLYLAVNQPDKALGDLDHVIRLNPKAARTIDLRGDVYLKL